MHLPQTRQGQHSTLDLVTHIVVFRSVCSSRRLEVMDRILLGAAVVVFENVRGPIVLAEYPQG
jgi:hypothetical protein